MLPPVSTYCLLKQDYSQFNHVRHSTKEGRWRSTVESVSYQLRPTYTRDISGMFKSQRRSDRLILLYSRLERL